jgi:hypothetical protein
MNRIVAFVKSIEDKEIVTYITLEVNGIEIRVIKSRVPQWLVKGEKVHLTFQELATCVGKSCDGKVSIENRISSTLSLVRQKGTLCELTMESAIGKVVALMTEKSFKDLQISIGDETIILLREIDINLEPYFESIHIDPLMNTRMKVAN